MRNHMINQPKKSWRAKLANVLNPRIRTNDYNTISFSNSARMDIHVYKAIGGFVIEYHAIDPIMDEAYRPTLHLIKEGEDLGKALGHIITVEMLKKY